MHTSPAEFHINEHLSKLANFGDRMALILSMTTKEGDHSRAAQLLHTGTLAQDQVQYPAIGSLLAKELGAGDAVLPGFVSIAPNRGVSPLAHGPGFLGPNFAPLVVADGGIVSGQPQ